MEAVRRCVRIFSGIAHCANRTVIVYPFIQGASNIEIQVFTVVQAQAYMPSLSYRSYRKLWLWSSN